MGKEKVVFDTNVLVSAFGWGGTPRRALDAAILGEFALVVSKSQLCELERVLGYPKLGFSGLQKRRFLALILSSCVLVEVSGALAVVREDPSDDVLLETAVEHGARWLVTGDSHLLKLKQFGNVAIVAPGDFLLRAVH